jgi:hypothetical protein
VRRGGNPPASGFPSGETGKGNQIPCCRRLLPRSPGSVRTHWKLTTAQGGQAAFDVLFNEEAESDPLPIRDGRAGSSRPASTMLCTTLAGDVSQGPLMQSNVIGTTMPVLEYILEPNEAIISAFANRAGTGAPILPAGRMRAIENIRCIYEDTLLTHTREIM